MLLLANLYVQCHLKLSFPLVIIPSNGNLGIKRIQSYL